jgi:hypothetical protein
MILFSNENTNIPDIDPNIDCEEIASATDGCNLMATGEGNGGYNTVNTTTGASGRYQFRPKTAHYTLIGMGKATSESEAATMWNKCAASTSAECVSLQNEMCEWYINDTVRQMKHWGVPPTKKNMYLAWQQGAQGASIILRAASNGEQVTNKTVRSNMASQAFFTGDEKNDYSGELFMKEFDSYLKRQNFPGV